MGHVPPQPGEPQPLQSGVHVVAQGPEPSFVTVNNRLFAPLESLDPDNVLMGGYGWLSLTDGGATYHPGLDLNSGSSCNDDQGKLVVTPLAGRVQQCLYWDGFTPGEGNHVWIELTDPLTPGPTWFHVDHLDQVMCRTGQDLPAGGVIGSCGRSGGWDCAHAHSEWVNGSPPYGWWQWPYGWSREQVEAAYYSPMDWWLAASARVQGASEEVGRMILSGAQSAAIQAVVWGSSWDPAAADFAIPSSWRDEWRAGRWRGGPLSDEQAIPEDTVEGKPAGAWQLFEFGAACWLPGEPVSWNG